MLEIERKFLVSDPQILTTASKKNYLKQGYLNRDPARTVRVRIQNDQGLLTVKGKSNESGTTRIEWETQIHIYDAEDLLALCEPGIIEKNRHLITVDGHLFEVDQFLGANEGLLLAEIELPAEDASFPKPDWLGQEVTGEHRYYNSYLSNHPFSQWP